jgi:hypothetical protein
MPPTTRRITRRTATPKDEICCSLSEILEARERDARRSGTPIIKKEPLSPSYGFYTRKIIPSIEPQATLSDTVAGPGDCFASVEVIDSSIDVFRKSNSLASIPSV